MLYLAFLLVFTLQVEPTEPGKCEELANNKAYSNPNFPLCPATDALKNIVVSGQIADYAFFKNNDIAQISLKDVTSIGQYAFAKMKNLNKILIHSDDTKGVGLSIPSHMAEGCSSLTSFPFDDKINSYGESCFEDCTSLAIALEFPLSTCNIFKRAFYNTPVIVDFIPTSTTVYESAFQYCKGIGELDFNGKFGSGCVSAFESSSITNLFYEGSDISKRAFYDCTNIESIKFKEFSTNAISIGESAFYGLSKITELSFNKVTSISLYSFQSCASLTSIKFGSVTSFASNSFQGCALLEKITFDKATSIPSSAFKDFTKLTEVDLGNAKSISSSAFQGCSKLNKINLANVEYIYDSAFKYCTELTEVDLGNAKSISSSAFQGCTNLQTIKKIGKDIKNIESSEFKDCSSLVKIDLSLIKTISESAFKGCTNLNGIDLSSVTSIAESAFEDCSSLTIINLESLESFDKTSFKGCTSLQEITFGTVESIPENAFEGLKSLKKMNKFRSVTSISESAFQDCSNLEEIDLSSVTIFNSYAFKGCTSLGEVDLRSAGTISESAFENCKNLKIKVFGKSVTSISDSAFKGCSNLDAIDLSSVTSISQYAFQDCKQLSAIDLRSANSIYQSAFQDCTSLEEVRIGTSAPSIYQSAFQGCSRLSKINLIGFTSIPDSAFKGCTSLGEVDLRNLGSISDSAFEGCTNLKIIAFGKSVKSISDSAFKDCSKLDAIDLSSVTSISQYAFQGCKRLSEIDLSSVTSISQCAFSGCTNVRKIEFSSNNEYQIMIPLKAFEDISNIQTLKIHNANIQQYAFSNCKIGTLEIIGSTVGSKSFEGAEINKVLIKNTEDIQSEISGSAFYNAKIQSITLTHVELSSNAFRYLSDANTINLKFEYEPNGENFNIGNYAFYRTNVKIQNLELTDSVISIGSLAFAHCQHLSGNLIINAKVILKGAFYQCRFNNVLTLQDNLQYMFDQDPDSTKTLEETPGVPTEKTPTPTPVPIFEGCMFTKVTLSKNLQAIPSETFKGMNTITGDVTIPKSVKQIGDRAFYKCNQLTLKFEDDAQKDASLTIGEDAFNGVNIKGAINRGINSINPYAFYGLSDELDFYFSPTISTIPEFSFANTKLKSLTIPKELERIDEGAFMNCKLQSPANLEIPDTCESIGEYAFYGCTNLASLTLNNKINKIEPYSFYGTSISRNVNLELVSTIGQHAFDGCSGITSVTLYKPKEGPAVNNEGNIQEAAFRNCVNLRGGISLEYIHQIGKEAFYQCPINTVNLGENIRSIPDRAFYKCIELQGTPGGNLVIPNTVSYIGDEAFYGCQVLAGNLIFDYDETNVALNSNEIGKYAFYGCTQLNGQLNFSSHFSSIKAYAFADLTGLTGSLDLSGVQEIGDYAFSGCTNLNDYLRIEPLSNDKAMTIGKGAFQGCTGFKDGSLYIYVKDNERAGYINYFLRIEDDSFKDTKFKTVYYSGRFDPDCTADTGLKKIKKFKPYNYYANSSFCGKKIKGLSGGAIAGIVIACIVVAAAIAVLVVFLILRNKKNRDNSENEVEMNGSP